MIFERFYFADIPKTTPLKFPPCQVGTTRNRGGNERGVRQNSSEGFSPRMSESTMPASYLKQMILQGTKFSVISNALHKSADDMIEF